MKNITVLFAMLFLTLINQTQAQFASYSFDTNANDIINGYNANIYGSPSYLTDGDIAIIELEGDEFLSLPSELSTHINPEGSFMYTIRFKVTDNYDTNPYNGETTDFPIRILVANKTKHPNGLGFNLIYRRGIYSNDIVASYGDDVLQFGQEHAIAGAQVGVWYEITVKMYFNVPVPYIQYVISVDEGDTFTKIFNFDPNVVNIDRFTAALNKQKIWVGTDVNNSMSRDGKPFAKVNIDKLIFYDAVPLSDPTIINTLLSSLIDDMNGTTTLSDAEKDALHTDFVLNWDPSSYASNKAIIASYLETCNSQYGVIFEDQTRIEVSDMPVPQRIQFAIQQWMTDNLYTTTNTSEMSGISFLDHTAFPGAVSSAAPRVNAANFNVDGTYKTDSGFKLSNTEAVVRPSGYYAAPGELTTLIFPENIINKGIKVRVGAHQHNLAKYSTSFNRFPRISTLYDVTATSLTVANPFGGAIYVTFPDGANYGTVTCQISGAVKSPYYSTKPGFERSLADYKTDLANSYVKWVDWESLKFMTTFPAPAATTVNNPDDVISLWDQTFNMFNVILGRPLDNFRAEYLLIDSQNLNGMTVAPAIYPMPLRVGNSIFEADPTMIPINVINGNAFMKGTGPINGVNHATILHEMGHLYHMPYLANEGETMVNLPAVAAYNRVFGQSIDDALKYSFQGLNFDEAALDWMLPLPFRAGERMEVDMLPYQTRGYAKYADIAQLYSWETLGEIHEYFYDEGMINTIHRNDNIKDDIYISAASEKLNTNMAPLLEFWGIIPSDQLVEQLKKKSVDVKIKNRLLHYRSIVPADNTAFKVVYDNMTAKLGDGHDVRYDDMLSTYNEVVADAIVARIDVLLCKYYDNNCIAANSDGTPTVAFALSADSIDENSDTDVTLTATLDVLSSETVNIDFILSGTAAETADYIVSSQNITIAAGAKSGNISISTSGLDDNIIEVLQTVVFTPSVTNATTNTETLTLNFLSDDNPTVTSITTSETSIIENGGVSVITAEIDTPASKPTHIALDIIGTADYSIDYTGTGEYTITTVAGGNGAGTAKNQFNFASGLHVDISGNIYVADLLNHRVQKWAPGAFEGTTVAGGNGAGAAANQLSNPQGIFVDTSGNVYIADSENHRIQKWAPGAVEGTTVAGSNGKASLSSAGANDQSQLNTPNDIFVKPNGDIYIADMGASRIQKWAPGATEGVQITGGTYANVLQDPSGIFISDSEDIYIASTQTNNVVKWESEGLYVTKVAGSYGQGNNANQLNHPKDVFVDPAKNVYVADYENNRVQKWNGESSYNPNVTIETVAGGNGQGSAANQFDGPKSIFVDAAGDLYVADMKNHRIQKYHYVPKITIPAGETTGTLTVTAVADSSDDNNETIVITPTTVTNAISSHTDTHTITIVDDDEPPVVNFKWSAESIDENSARDVILTATLSNTSNKEITIDFALSGTAIRTTEYTISSTSITIPAGVNSGNLTLSTRGLDDDAIEIAETIVFTSTLTNATTTTGTITLNVLSDDPPTVTAITVDQTNIQENGGVSLVTATINQATSKPVSILLDMAGTAIYDSDYDTEYIVKGNVTTAAGENGQGATPDRLNNPNSVFVDTSENLYIADRNTHRIQKWTAGATKGTTVAGGNWNGSGSLQLNEPTGVVVDASGNVYVSDMNNHRIQRWAPGAVGGDTAAGALPSNWNGGESSNLLKNPHGFFVTTSGDMYIADTDNHRIQKWLKGASEATTVAGGNEQGDAANQLDSPHGVYVDALDNIYVADAKNNRIQKWIPEATEGATVAGGNDTGDAANQLDTPTGVFVNTTGSIYIADTNNHRIQRWAPGATKGITVAGGHGQGDADNQLNTPTGIFVSATGSVYIADKVNHRIQKYYYTPEITIAAGETSGSVQVTGLEDTSSASKGVDSRTSQKGPTSDDNNNDDGDEIIALTPTGAKNATLAAGITTTITITISDSSSLDIEDVVINDADTVLAYPNPSDGIFEIAVPISEKEVSIVIYNIYGQLISKRTYLVSYGKVNLDIKNQPIGIYLAKVQLEVPVTIKIIKK
jgi:sugar lactone lactonase YvrE